jgi:hypothetical protein
MEIIKVTQDEYKNIIPNPYHVFNNADFNVSNESKCERIVYLLFKDTKYRLGIIGGINDNKFTSPFSAPFGGFSFLKEDIRIKYIEEAIVLLTEWCRLQNLKKICITLPPSIYDNKFITKQINALYRNDFNIENIDMNYHFESENFKNNYINSIWYSARKSLKKSFTNDLLFKFCSSLDEKQEAYSVIEKNRNERGYPLRMTFDDILSTDHIINKDFFIVYKEDGESIASAVVYYVSNIVAQVIYWGDSPEHSSLRSMNFLSFKIFEYYLDKGIKFVDIGPSTERSIPNYGLCDFKESIGCDILSKFTFIKTIKG